MLVLNRQKQIRSAKVQSKNDLFFSISSHIATGIPENIYEKAWWAIERKKIIQPNIYVIQFFLFLLKMLYIGYI